MLKTAAIAVIIAAATSLPASSFEMNSPLSDVLSARGTLSVRDLAVGEVGIVTYADFCTSNGRLFGQGVMALQESSDLSSVVQKVKKMTGGTFELTIRVLPDADKPLAYWVANFAVSAFSPCLESPENLFEITSVNGNLDLRDLLADAN